MPKQTILTVPLDRALHTNPTDSEYLSVTRRAYSIDGYDPVLVTISVGRTWCRVLTTCLPGGGWWREPNAETLRMLVDHELFKRKMTRTGKRESGPGWRHAYPIRSLNTPHPECPWRREVHAEHVFKHVGRMDDPSTGALIDCPGR